MEDGDDHIYDSPTQAEEYAKGIDFQPLIIKGFKSPLSRTMSADSRIRTVTPQLTEVNHLPSRIWFLRKRGGSSSHQGQYP